MAPRHVLSPYGSSLAFARQLGLLSVALLLPLLVSGCACFAGKQDWHYKMAQKRRASAAYRTCFSSDQRKCHSCDFEDGYKAGFVDTSTGKDCRLPPVPPPKYWAAKYQCCEGQAAIQDWFRGYQCGITAAESKGFPSFHEVPVSACAPVVNKTACGMCRSCEPCECANGACSSATVTPHYSTAPHDAASSTAVPHATAPHSPTSTHYQNYEAASPSDAAGVPIMVSPATRNYFAPEQPPSPQIGLIGGIGSSRSQLFGPVDAVFEPSATPEQVVSAEAMTTR